MADVVRRIQKASEITETAEWQIHRTSQMGFSQKQIEKYVADTLKLSNAEVDRLFNDVLARAYEQDREEYSALADIEPYKDNVELQQLVKAVTTQTKKELVNITGSLGFSEIVNGKMAFKPIAEFYQQTLDEAIAGLVNGSFTYDTVIRKAINKMTASGLRTVDYASGWVNRTPVAARRAVMTGFNQVVNKISEGNAEKLDTEHFEVSYHIGARPTHAEWQGRVYSKAELESVCKLGTVTGLCGANCYHSYDPFIPDISERLYTDEQLDKMIKEENTPKMYQGKGYTTYEATQKQRKMETLMRKQRQDISLLEKGGASEDELITARCKYRKTSAGYKDFSKDMNLPEQRQRVTMDGLGAVGVGKYTKLKH